MLFNTLATLALATGFAVAKPIATPQDLPVYVSKRDVFGGNGGNNFNFIDGFNRFNDQEQVIQIQEESIQIIDNGRRQQVIEQATQVLIVENSRDGFNRKQNDLFRKANFRNNNRDRTVVLLVVTEIQIVIDDGRNRVQEEIFAQSVIVANRGQRATETVMIFAAETLIAQNILGNGRDGRSGSSNIPVGQLQGSGLAANGSSNVNGTAPAQAVQTQGVQLFGSKPTWSSVAADPAATLGAVWQAELQDAVDAQNFGLDNGVNSQAALQEVKSLLGKKN